jgi:hypothetical protein
VVDGVAVEHVFCLSTSVSPCHYHFTNAAYWLFIHISQLSEGQAGGAWELPNKAVSIRVSRSAGRKLRYKGLRVRADVVRVLV